ncbi:hypothetical protein D3C81_2097890 [compost metagenome]
MSLNDGIGVPDSPVLTVRKMSFTDAPDLNCPVVRLAGGIGKPKSSSSPAAFSPSPLPLRPWHSQHLARSQACLPRWISSAEGLGGTPIKIGASGGSSRK